MPGRRLRLTLFLLALFASLAATPVFAELTQKGNIFVRFDGGISPTALPRSSPAPIGVRVEGTVRAPPGDVPPSLRQIRIALNRSGRLDTRGLPRCRRGQIAAATPAEALAVCGDALVGAGGIVARTSFEGQPRATLRGDLLFFNAVQHGQRVILAHLFATNPVPAADIIVFHIHRAKGAFGTAITARIPPTLNRNGYLKSIFLRLQRTYSFHGRRHAYLSAACAAPRGFDLAVFPFARASMGFENGTTLSATLVRSCKVRGG